MLFSKSVFSHRPHAQQRESETAQSLITENKSQEAEDGKHNIHLCL